MEGKAGTSYTLFGEPLSNSFWVSSAFSAVNSATLTSMDRADPNPWPTWGDVADILIAMGRTLSTHWIKGSLYIDGHMCMFGAFLYGTGVLRDRKDAASRIVGGLLGDVVRLEATELDIPLHYASWNTVVFFNDSLQTGHGDVLRVISTAVKVARQMEEAGEKLSASSFPEAVMQGELMPFDPVPPVTVAPEWVIMPELAGV